MNKEINNNSNFKLQKEPIFNGNLTGYPSKDLPWNKFYRMDFLWKKILI